MITKIVISAFCYLICCIFENVILQKEEIRIKQIWILFGISLPALLWFNVPFITIMCYPLLVGQCFIDFTKLELSDYNNAMLFLASMIYSFQNGFNFKSFIIIGVLFFLLYLMPFSNMGFGDVKMLFATALFVPSKLILSYIFYMLAISLVIGICYKIFKKQNEFPMGPAIAIMSFVIQII